MSVTINTTMTNPLGAAPWETVPHLIPSVAEDVWVGDAHVTEIHLVNGTSTSVTVTINDKQTTPMPIIPTAVVVPANSDLVWEFTGRYCKGGINWVASAANAVTGYVRAW